MSAASPEKITPMHLNAVIEAAGMRVYEGGMRCLQGTHISTAYFLFLGEVELVDAPLQYAVSALWDSEAPDEIEIILKVENVNDHTWNQLQHWKSFEEFERAFPEKVHQLLFAKLVIPGLHCEARKKG